MLLYKAQREKNDWASLEHRTTLTKYVNLLMDIQRAMNNFRYEMHEKNWIVMEMWLEPQSLSKLFLLFCIKLAWKFVLEGLKSLL